MKLKKPLGALDVFCLAAGSMISSGLFVLPGLIFVLAGPAAILAYLLAGLLMIPSLLAQAELATAMPKAGGTYFFIERSLGPFGGTLAGLANWFSISFKSAFALVGMGAFAVLVFEHISPLQMKFVAVGCCAVFAILNLVSVKAAGRAQIWLVMVLLAIVGAYVVLGTTKVDVHAYDQFMEKGWAALLAATGMVFISFGGLTKVASVSEEVKRPGRNIPLGMIAAFVVVSILYVLVVAVTVGLGVMSADPGSPSLTPISDGAGALFDAPFDRPGVIILSIAALFAFITTANAGILSASRAPMAMSRDQLLPRFFARVNGRFQTPHYAILFTFAFMAGVILFLDLEALVKTASTLMLLLFVFVNVSLIIMRASRIHSYRPEFRCPGYPWMQIGAIVVYGFLIAEMGRLPLTICGAFLVAGLAWYAAYVRAKVGRRSALIHVVERIVDRKLGTGTLEGELKDILVERDNIVEDRFDRLIKTCTILDMEGPTTYEEFFETVAYHASQHLHTSADSLYHQLVDREKESTTAIAPGLAIPHMIIQGEQKFDILLARCKRGIRFQESGPPVHTVFVLLGTRDERSFHLKSLMWIAQIARNAEFRQRWMNARDEQELRNIILLAARERDVQA